jgi:hypothetical protein
MTPSLKSRWVSWPRCNEWIETQWAPRRKEKDEIERETRRLLRRYTGFMFWRFLFFVFFAVFDEKG